MLVALAGGVGAARMLTGLVQVVDPEAVTAVVNTGDDVVLHGLRISPDIDTVTYTLAGVVNPGTGWGLAGETWTTMEALERYGGITWFRLGDRDLATHLYRTQRLAEGASLSQVTAEITQAWGLRLRLLPMSDDRVETRVTLLDDDKEVGFQEYFVRRRHAVAVKAVRFEGAERAVPAPGVLTAVETASVVVLCPSNPIVSIGPLLAVPQLRAAIKEARERCVAVSPIVAGAALKGPADRLLAELGQEPSVVGVAQLYSEYAASLVIDQADSDLAGEVAARGMRPIVAPAVMRGPSDATNLARVVVGAVISDFS